MMNRSEESDFCMPIVASSNSRSPFPFLKRIGRQLAEHDDRDQFRAGIEIILAGIGSKRSAR
ncbi:hypothetical protein ASD65_11765 [Microbacterium sp. Root61]|nr:hypothetical protein ASD65_11765 [Microbacterium sp. Root61]